MKKLLARLNAHTVTAVVGAVVGLAVVNGLITNEDGKVITGAATALVALGVLIHGAIVHPKKGAPVAAPVVVSTGTSGTGGVVVTPLTPKPKDPPPAA